MTPSALFPDLPLVRRIEAAEADLAASCARIASAAGQAAITLPLSSGLAVFARAGSPVNKTVGIGIGCAVDPAELDAAERALRERGEALRIELASMAEPTAARLLTERGYRLEAFENVLGLALERTTGARAESAVAVDVVEAIDPWRNVLLDGFASPDDSPIAGETYARDIIEATLTDFVRMDGLRRYLARSADALAGAASMRLHGGIALLCGAATLPAYRRRGVQSALLTRRLHDAAALGADVAIVTTAPGSQSHANALRRGFRLLYVRAILIAPDP